MSRTTPIRAALTVLSAALLTAAASPAAAQGAPAAPRAADLYRQATRLYAEQKLAEAEPLYREAWELQHSYDIASNLGALELELGRPRLAAELLAQAVAQCPVRARAEERAALEARLVAAKKLVGTLRVKTEVAGAEIRVDGKKVGRAPLPSEIYVDPGAHLIEASFPGYGDARLVFRAEAGVTLDVRLPLAPTAPAPKRSIAPAIVGAALGVASAGAGAVLLVVGHAQENRAQSLHDSLQAAGTSCAGNAPGCADLRAATAKADRLGNAGVVMLAVAGAAAVGTVTYVLWPGAKPGAPKMPDVRASLGVGPTGGALLLQGSF